MWWLAQLGDIVSQLVDVAAGSVRGYWGMCRLAQLGYIVAQLVDVAAGSVRGYCG